nr:DUF6614 family protein [Roseovarius confluentis]
MNVYTCQIDLKKDAKSLPFAGHWKTGSPTFRRAEMVGNCSLLRRKLNLASGAHRDFLLQIELSDLAQLDRAFRWVGQQSA